MYRADDSRRALAAPCISLTKTSKRRFSDSKPRGMSYGAASVLDGPLNRSARPGPSTQWCHRRLLARIHRLTIGRLRKEIEPVSAAEYMRFLFQWQHASPGARLHGEAACLEVVKQLGGFEAAASAWEPQILRIRLAKYAPEWLDRLCLSGAVCGVV